MSTIDWPLSTNIIRRGSIKHTFGMVRRNSVGQRKPHQGWDLQATPGHRCYAIADGHIEDIYTSDAYGLVCVLAFYHQGRTLYAAYCHLSAVKVEKGAAVAKGDRIALTGESGNARAMASPDQHLHFEIRTVPRPGLGLEGRLDPSTIFGTPPLTQPAMRAGA